MKLSERIRLGAMLRPQAKGLFDNGGSCALGAALEAGGFPYQEAVDPRIIEALLAAVDGYKEETSCPCCTKKEEVWRVIEHLNDWHNWTRPQIAEWVKQFEPQACTSETVPVTETVSETNAFHVR